MDEDEDEETLGCAFCPLHEHECALCNEYVMGNSDIDCVTVGCYARSLNERR
jgi:hypothetical protein